MILTSHRNKLIFGGKICVVFKRNSSAVSHCMVITAHQPSLGCTARESSENITGGGTYCVYILGCIHSNCNVDRSAKSTPLSAYGPEAIKCSHHPVPAYS